MHQHMQKTKLTILQRDHYYINSDLPVVLMLSFISDWLLQADF